MKPQPIRKQFNLSNKETADIAPNNLPDPVPGPSRLINSENLNNSVQNILHKLSHFSIQNSSSSSSKSSSSPEKSRYKPPAPLSLLESHVENLSPKDFDSTVEDFVATPIAHYTFLSSTPVRKSAQSKIFFQNMKIFLT